MSQETIKRDILSELRQAAAGNLDIHVWRSNNYPGILMKTVVVEPGEPFDETTFEVFDGGYEPYYDGIMSTDEATKRHYDAVIAHIEGEAE